MLCDEVRVVTAVDEIPGNAAHDLRALCRVHPLSSTHGTFFVTGNHEYYADAPAWVAELRRIGLNVLMNEHAVLEHGGGSVLIAGVTDFSAHHFDPAQRSDPHAALAGALAGTTTRVLLAHQPRSAEAAEQAGFQLQLSGHTHGGQLLPWNLFVRFQQPFTAGLHKQRRLWVYTSRGTGYWGPPKRVGALSELTRVRLAPAVGRLGGGGVCQGIVSVAEAASYNRLVSLPVFCRAPKRILKCSFPKPSRKPRPPPPLTRLSAAWAACCRWC